MGPSTKEYRTKLGPRTKGYRTNGMRGVEEGVECGGGWGVGAGKEWRNGSGEEGRGGVWRRRGVGWGEGGEEREGGRGGGIHALSLPLIDYGVHGKGV